MKNPLKRRYIEIEEEEPSGDQTHLNISFETVCFSEEDDGEFSDETSCYSEDEYYSAMSGQGRGKPHFKSGGPESVFTEAVSFFQSNCQNFFFSISAKTSFSTYI